jgi:5'-deoxynucleotidase YfbR-like HD superfamily hydrolase
MIRNRVVGGHVNPEWVAALALYHDVGEVLTGDLPTPVKYFNPEIKNACQAIEKVAQPVRHLHQVPGRDRRGQSGTLEGGDTLDELG